MIRHQIARILKAYADRIEPKPCPTCVMVDMHTLSQQQYEILAKAIADVQSGEIGGRIGLNHQTNRY